MAFDLTAITSAGVAVLATLGTVWGASKMARPSSERALTERYNALIGRQIEEREHLERQIAKLEAVTNDLEVMVVKLTEWRDDVVSYLKTRGADDYPQPPRFVSPETARQPRPRTRHARYTNPKGRTHGPSL